MYLDILISRFKKSESPFENLNISVNSENCKFPQNEMKSKGTKRVDSIAGNIILTF